MSEVVVARQHLGQVCDLLLELCDSGALLSDDPVTRGNLLLKFRYALGGVHLAGRSCQRSRRHLFFQLFWGAAGWPRVVSSPGLPQIRTCPIKAYGSSGLWVCCVTQNRVYRCWLRQGKTFENASVPFPGTLCLEGASSQTLSPHVHDPIGERGECRSVARDPVVLIVTAELLRQHFVLLR